MSVSDERQVAEAIAVFARYGFRKASMDDVAAAFGLSRQGLYKRFGSKESVFRWVIDQALAAAHLGAMTALADKGVPREERLVRAFDQWAGQYVDILRSSPHAVEILGMAKADQSAETLSAETAVLDAMARTIGGDADLATEQVYALNWASKGLMMFVASRADYLAAMTRIIAIVLR